MYRKNACGKWFLPMMHTLILYIYSYILRIRIPHSSMVKIQKKTPPHGLFVPIRVNQNQMNLFVVCLIFKVWIFFMNIFFLKIGRQLIVWTENSMVTRKSKIPFWSLKKSNHFALTIFPDFDPTIKKNVQSTLHLVRYTLICGCGLNENLVYTCCVCL